MRQDQPTIPNQAWSSPESGNGASGDLYPSGPDPIWPDARARRSALTESTRAPRGYVSATLFGMSMGANVALLISLIGLVLLIYTGVIPLRGASQPAPGGPPLASGSSTATMTPAPSPTHVSGWLRVSPPSAQLGCDGDQRTQYLVLRNTGSSKISWQAQLVVSGDQAGVSVNPQSGRLSAGQSVSIQLQSTTQSSGQQGVIQFVPTSDNAGSPASFTYTTQGCGG